MYCLDDGAILKDHVHEEKSIAEVAEKCLPLVLKFAEAYGCGSVTESESHRSIILGGWSYGGVVASVITEKLAKSATVLVKGVVLFDAPLRLTVSKEENSDKSERNGFGGSDRKVSEHFAYCTRLLKQHYVRPVVEDSPVDCPVLDIRAEQSTYDGGHNALCEVSRGTLKRHKTSGDHFTMLFGENAIQVASLLQSFVRELPK